MLKKILLGLLFIVLLVALCIKSPFAVSFNYNKGKILYDSKQYELALPYFERAYFADNKNTLTKYYYILALSKAKPTYSNQKKLYTIANSKNEDEATKTAKYKIFELKKLLLADFSGNYISNALYGEDILRWDLKSFPLKIYYENNDNIPQYYVKNIEGAFNIWGSKTNFIKFENTKDKQLANIIVKFTDIPSDVCQDGNCKYAVAYTEPQINGHILKNMTLTFYKTDPKGKNFSERQILNTALHEIGHALGIMGHSDNPNDLMYSSKKELDNLASIFYKDLNISKNDIRTLVLLYRIMPTISNNPNIKNENLYYSPIIIGESEERFKKKIEEYEQYIKNYPTLSAGYINLASVYADMGNMEEALANLAKANNYAKTNDEKYLINYNKAILYYNIQQYQQSLEFARIAQGYKNDSNIEDLISELEEIKAR